MPATRKNHFKCLRRIVWSMLATMLAYLFFTSFFEPSRAQLLSQTEGFTAYMTILWENVYALVSCLSLLMMAVTSFCILFTLRSSLSAEMRQAVLCLSEFILAGSIWVLTDSHFLSFVTARNNLVALISYLSFTSMFAFLFEFFGHLMERLEKFGRLCVFFYMMAALQILYFIRSLVPRMAIIAPVHVGCVIGAFIVIRDGLWELKHKQMPEMRCIIRGFTLFLLISLVAIGSFYVAPRIRYSSIYALGVVIFCVHLIVAALMTIRRQIEIDANESAYRRMAYTDMMTGLMNKAAYIEEEQKPLNDGCIYLMMDINNLKQINDQYGHRKGDEVIVTAAGYIRRHFEKALCYRFGGDEFIVICRNYTTDEVRDVISGMRAEMERDNRNRETPVVLAIGSAIYRQGDTVETMFHRADLAMYQDKANQKSEPFPQQEA